MNCGCVIAIQGGPPGSSQLLLDVSGMETLLFLLARRLLTAPGGARPGVENEPVDRQDAMDIRVGIECMKVNMKKKYLFTSRRFAAGGKLLSCYPYFFLFAGHRECKNPSRSEGCASRPGAVA